MSDTLKGLFYDVVGVGWKVFNDFTPKNTIDQVAAIIRDLRDRQFESAHDSVRSRLEAKLSAAKSTQDILSKTRKADDSELQQHQLHVKTLEKLLSYQKPKRDVDLGSLSRHAEVGKEWQVAEEHPSTFDFFKDKLKDTMSVLFEDRDRFEETIELRTLMKHQQDILNDLKENIEPDHREAIDRYFKSVNLAADAFRKPDPPKASAKSTKKSSGSDNKDIPKTRIEIPID